MGNLRYGSGSVTVEMSDTLDRLAREAIDRVQPGLIAELTRTAQQVHANAVRRWPVRTGTSRAGLTWYLAISEGGTEIRAVVSTGGVPYTWYIRPQTLYNGNTGWNEWVQRPMRAAGPELAKVLGPIISRQLGGG